VKTHLAIAAAGCSVLISFGAAAHEKGATLPDLERGLSQFPPPPPPMPVYRLPPPPILSITFSGAAGAWVSPKGTTSLVARTSAASPVDGEIALSFWLGRFTTFDLGYIQWYDLSDDYFRLGINQTAWYGMRPGFHFYAGDFGVVPYIRVAVPIVWAANYAVTGASDRDIGILIGAGVEFRLPHFGIFLEASATPMVTHDNLLLIEGRLGFALHI
jgi:hypothetical protein